jgi:acyl-CoA thioester hydrolase
MPRSFTRRFRIRHYECDANGHLNNASYLRFMQEAATDASADAGYDEDRYRQMDRTWLAYATEIEYFQPCGYNDTLEVKTWVMDFRRASSRRVYEFRLADSGELIARAHTDWIYLNTQTGKTISIPPEMAESFYPEGPPESFPARPPYPAAPPPPQGAFRWRRQVEWKDIDQLQHVNNAIYLEYAGECGAQHVAALGWPWERMKQAGFAIFLRRNHIQYKQPALLRDELEIATWLYQVRRSTAMRIYTIRRAEDGALLSEIHAMGVCVNLASGQPVRWPEQLMVDLAPSISS